jgi:hypothetical protein
MLQTLRDRSLETAGGRVRLSDLVKKENKRKGNSNAWEDRGDASQFCGVRQKEWMPTNIDSLVGVQDKEQILR